MRTDKTQGIWLFMMTVSTLVGLIFHLILIKDPSYSLFYFTVQSNLLLFIYSLVTLIYIGIRKNKQMWWSYLAGFVTLCMTIAGLTYTTLLADWKHLLTLEGMGTFLLHAVSPLLVLIYFFILTPKVTIPYRYAFFWLAYPLLFVVVSLFRGHQTGWYPYWFLNYAELGNRMWLYLLGLALAFLVLGLLLLLINNKIKKGSLHT